MKEMNELLYDIRMDGKKHVRAKDLSGGEKRKLSVLQAIVYGTNVSSIV